MIPILVAITAIIAAGTALALTGGDEDRNEIPSGYPPEPDSREEEKINPVDPENGKINPVDPEKGLKPIQIGKIETRAVPFSTGFQVEITAYVFGISLNEVEVSLPEGVNHIINKQSKAPTTLGAPVGNVFIILNLGWSASVTVTIGGGGCYESFTVSTPAELPGASVPGASPALEMDLVLAPGDSKAISIPPEYLSLLAMVQWFSSDPSVCEVSADPAKGTVTAVAHKAGRCDLTASFEFYSAVCHVTVA